MKIVIAGGSGQIGGILARAYRDRGDEVVILSRAARSGAWRTVVWDGETVGGWAQELDGADTVINLAGRSVDCRYNAANRRAIMDSRVLSTRAIGVAIARAQRPPRLWLQASTATMYAHRYDAANDEDGILGGYEHDMPSSWRFSLDVAKAWEDAARACETSTTRLVLMRSAMTMSPDRGGVFAVLLSLVRHGLGGRFGDGRQYVSWIHELDFVRALSWISDHEELRGPINLAAPGPLPNVEFMAELRRAWGARIGLPTPAWLIEIGAFFMRTESELVLKSRRVIPSKLLRSGFAFTFPDWPTSAVDLCDRWKREARGRK
jgi:uncharacterized protein